MMSEILKVSRLSVCHASCFHKKRTEAPKKCDGINLCCFQPKSVEFPKTDMTSIEDIEAGK